MPHATLPFEAAIARLHARLAAPLPGLAKFMEMAPENRAHKPVHEARACGCREGSVLVLLYPIAGEAHLVLTERAAHLRNHAGQISFPGGRLDPGEDAVQGALREAWEEVGVTTEAVRVLGTLSQLYIPPSHFCLTPVVAVAAARPTFRLQASEVAALVEPPISHFVDPTHRRAETRHIEGEPRRIPYYHFPPHKIWGATAMMLTELATLWHEALVWQGAD